MNTEIKKLHIWPEDNGDWLFHDQYVIPLYQRVYTWSTEKEILGLLNAINAIEEESSDKKNYWLGVLSVIPKKEGEYEVVDGQQRLTTLYLLLKALSKWDLSEEHKSSEQEKQGENPFKDAEGKLRFDFREIANDTLNDLGKKGSNKDGDTGIRAGFEGICGWIDGIKKTESYEKFLKKLKRVSVYRVSLPEEIDPCKYFIRLNSRGKQLELVDVLKARLISTVGKNAKDQEFFADIWEACSRMDVYLQETIGKEIWDAIFGKDWENEFSTLAEMHEDRLKDNLKKEENSASDDENLKSISIVNFPTFLMHVLKLRASKAGSSEDTKLSQAATDDTKLVTYFEKHWEYAFESSFENRSRNEVVEFLRRLLYARYLFDGWIVRRKLKNEKPEGWTIQHLDKKEDEDKKGNFHLERVVSFELSDEKEQKTSKKIEMLQSCLRVTYSSPSSMPWITELLKKLWALSEGNNNLDSQGKDVLNFLEKYSCERVKEELKDIKEYEKVSKGTATPRILFNFLDYLLWRDCSEWFDELPKEEKKTVEEGLKNFKFSYLSSVEHWFPQNPKERKPWDEVDQFGNLEVDQFGNLFLIGGGENSSLSNATLGSKKEKINEWVNNGTNISLKGLCMYAKTTDDEETWKKTSCKKLGKEHYEKLNKEIKEKLDKHS